MSSHCLPNANFQPSSSYWGKSGGVNHSEIFKYVKFPQESNAANFSLSLAKSCEFPEFPDFAGLAHGTGSLRLALMANEV